MKNTQPYCIIAELMQLNTQMHLLSYFMQTQKQEGKFAHCLAFGNKDFMYYVYTNDENMYFSLIASMF